MKLRERGNSLLYIVLIAAVMIMVTVAVIPTLGNPYSRMPVNQLLAALGTHGYTIYATPAGDFYVNNLYPNLDSTYNIGGSGNEFAEGYFDTLYLSGNPPVTLAGTGRVWMEFRPDIDPTKLAKNSVPTAVERGICLGYSLPVGGADEELFLNICVPDRYDGESDIYVHVRTWLDTAQDEAADAVKLQLSWRAVSVGEVVPDTYYNVTDEVVVGVVAQYTEIEFEFVLDYDVEPANPVEGDDNLFLHLTRIGSSHEIAGEPVVSDMGVIFRFDKIGVPVP